MNINRPVKEKYRESPRAGFKWMAGNYLTAALRQKWIESSKFRAARVKRKERKQQVKFRENS